MTLRALQLIGRFARPSLRFEERLSGGYRLSGAHGQQRELPLRITLEARSDPRAPLIRFEVSGGFVRGSDPLQAPLVGGEISVEDASLGWRLCYALQLAGAGDRWIVASKELTPGELYAGFTTLRGRLEDRARGEQVAELCLRFDARGDVGWWLKGLRVRRGGALARPAR